MSLPRISIGRPVAVSMLFVAVAILGGLSFTRLPVDLLPTVAYPKLVVYTSYPGVAPREVERFVTEKVESALAQVPGKLSMESTTREGMSLVTVRFAWGTDMDFANLNVREKLDGIRGSLPDGVDGRPIVLRTDPQSDPIMSISVSGGVDLWSLKELSETVFRRRLEQIDGVAQASVTGGLTREVEVTVEPRLLESYGLTVDDVARALEAANAQSVAATVRHGNFDFSLRTLGELRQVREMEDIVVALRPIGGGEPGTSPRAQGRVLVRDVATVTDGFQERESIARYNGEESVGLLVFKEAGANTVDVTGTVNEILDELRAQYPAIHLDVASSQAEFVAGAIDNLKQQMLLGGLMAFLVLIFFLRDARYSVAIALGIPISVIGTFALLQLAGVTLNIMSLGGLALGLGMLVDNSIVVIENVFRHRERGVKAALAAAIGTEEVMRAITASTLTTIAVFGPIVYVRGVAGELFGALSFAVIFSLLVSLLVAVTLLPTMAARWEEGGTRKEGGRLRRSWRPLGHALAAPLRAFERGWNATTRGYHGALAWALDHRALVLTVAALLFAASIPVALGLERSVLPEVDQGEFRVAVALPRGTPLERTSEFTAGVEEALLADPSVEAVFSRIGKQIAAAGFEARESGVHTALLEVRLHPHEATAPVLARLRQRFASLPPGTLAFEAGQATALGKLLGAGEADLAVRVRAENVDEAMAYAAELEAVLAQDDRLANVRMGTELGQPEFLANVNREAAAAYNINPVDVRSTVEQNMYGRKATDFVAFDAKIPVWVRLPREDRRNLETLTGLEVRGVPLAALVDVEESTGPVEIQRVEQNRVIPVFADVATGGVDDAVAAVEARLADHPPPDRDMRVVVGGENEEMRRSFQELTLAFALAILLVYMVLAAQFESFLHPFTILFSVPMALIGAVVALHLFGAGLNTVSLIGIVILVGIVNNDAVVKVDYINQLRAAGMGTREALLEAGLARIRPIVMTTVTTMVGVTPMMLGLGAGGNLQAPLAIAVFGGLLTSTTLTLLVLPLVYEALDDAGVWMRIRLLGRPAPQAAPATATPRGGAAQLLEPAGGGD